jgi:hypothetical protein
MKKVILFLQMILLITVGISVRAQNSSDGKLHIIIIGAHPDDPDEVGSCAYKWAQLGHDVLMVSVTNGDAGHQSVKAPELARAKKPAERESDWYPLLLDNRDGQLCPL